jgi:hypothetical protein
VSRDDEVDEVDEVDRVRAIVELSRRTRAPVPRGLWIAAAIVGAISAAGLAVALLGDAEPAAHHAEGSIQGSIERPAAPGAGFGAGLAAGAAGGLGVGFALGRQRRDHSSRRRP